MHEQYLFNYFFPIINLLDIKCFTYLNCEQNFAKNLLDVADNLGRASSVVKDSFSKIDSSKDTVGAVPHLKTLLEGVEMTEKQLAEVFYLSLCFF